MADIKSNTSSSSGSINQVPNASSSATMALPIELQPPEVPDELFDDAEEEPVSAISAEDGESLIGLAMSRAATRLKSAQTPALEKQSALEEEGGYFESDPETPPADGTHTASSFQTIKPVAPINDVSQAPPQTQRSKNGRGMSLGGLPTSNFKPSLPSPWLSGPKEMVVRPSGAPQSSLAAVFNSGTERKRSLSGGADALRRLLPKGLPSMAQVGNLFGSSSSSHGHRSKLGSTSFSKDSYGFPGRSGSSSISGSPNRLSPEQPRSPVVAISSPRLDIRPQPIRRVASDDSMLYHSLSRASSLGDDSR